MPPLLQHRVLGQNSHFNIDRMSPRNLIPEETNASKQVVVCQTKLNRAVATAMAKLEVLTSFNNSLSSGHDTATYAEDNRAPEEGLGEL